MDHYDVILIGTGAGGGTLLHKLAHSGKRILVLERGGFLPREAQNWDAKSVFLEGRYKNAEEWLDAAGKPFTPGTHYYVGGNTKVYGAALFRMRERDFHRVVHHDGVSPAWPIEYGDLEPYYTEAEALYRVRGQRGEDPSEPRASKPYPFARVEHEPRIQRLHDDLAAEGLHPFHVPLGIQYDPARTALEPCIRCATCDGFPCLVDAKADADTLCVRPAARRANVTLLTDARVDRLLTDGSGRSVRKVEVTRGGQREEYSADIVVVACGAVNSAALLLRSWSNQHRNGLANSSGVVGRHYMAHVNSVMLAVSREPNPTVFQKTIAVNDFYFGGDDSNLPLGHISMVGKSDKVVLKAGAPPFAPGVVLDWMAKHALDFWLTTEDLPSPDNRVRLDHEGRIVLDYRPNNLEAHRRLQRRLKQTLRAIAKRKSAWPLQHLFLSERIPLAGVAHQCGTVRFGSDPTTSALDLNCKAHDLDNLYVVDGSFFVSSAAVNPALTIMANALRVGQHLLERLHAGRTELAHR